MGWTLRNSLQRLQSGRVVQARELREQLSRIPAGSPSLSPPPAIEPQPTTADVSRAEPVAATKGDATSPACQCSCPICLSDVEIRVALQPCGHTACRDCIARLVESNQSCHICRGPLEGVMAVYV